MSKNMSTFVLVLNLNPNYFYERVLDLSMLVDAEACAIIAMQIL